ncbi:SDR family NAD(P)-dependent oxidoreductase, partial [Mesorhizobium sp. LCM 4576]
MTQSKKVVIITGATSGIGEAISEAFAKEEATLVLVGRDRDRGQRALEHVEKFDCTAQLVLGDVTDSSFAD